MAKRFVLAFLAAIFLLCTGCNVIAMKQSGIERSMRDAGLTAQDTRIGPDTIHYWSGGKGPTVLLVHGFGASGMWLWYPQVQDLARDHRVIVPDLLWFGASSSTNRDYGIDHQVRAVEALMAQLGVHEADVVGVSYGGLVAHELASDRGGTHAFEARTLVMVDTPGRVYTREDYRILCRRMHVDHVGKVLVPRDPEGVDTLLGLAYFDPPWVPEFALKQTLDSLYQSFRDERVALLDALLDNMDALKARPVTLRARPMVIWGRQDPVFPLEVGERLAHSLKAPLRVIESARHAPNLEHPEEFNRILRVFLTLPSGG